MIAAQFVAVPLSLVAGLVAAIAAIPFFSFLASGPWTFYGTGLFFSVAAPVTHGVFAVGLLIERAWAYERAVLLAWVLMVGESIFVVAGAIALDITIAVVLLPLLALDVVTLVYVRHPLVEDRLRGLA